MKDNGKLRTSWSVSSVLRRLLSIPRAGSKQQSLGNLLFAVVAGLLTVCIIWGPTLSSTPTNAPIESISSLVSYKFLSNSALDEKSKVADNDDKYDELELVEEKVSLDEAGEEEKTVVAVVKGKKESSRDSGTAAELPSVISEQKWNTAGFSFSPKYSDWDKQRAAYLKKNPHLRPPVGRESRVMLVTGSSPVPCSRTIGSYLFIMAAKNKLDYARLHDIQLYYNMASPDPTFDGWWTKIPLLRMLMVNHPEVDWFWWVDSDAWLTDMAFEVPFDRYTAAGKNFFLYGDNGILYEEGSWLGINTGNMGIRNCQWSLDLLDAWATFGIKGIRERSGKVLTQNLNGRPEDFAADDQSALAYLLINEKKKWASKVALEMSYTLSGHWPTLTSEYEELMKKYHPGFGDHRWPLCVHFAGCQPCSDVEGYGKYQWDQCLAQMLRTYDFADNQVLQTMGFKLEGKLGGASKVVPVHGEQPARVEGELYHIYPNVSDWDEQRAAYMKKSKDPRGRKESKAKVLLVSGSGARECPQVRGTHFLLKSLKNKIDYARMHDMEFFYNMANLDGELMGWWMKIPIVRAMMLAHPEVEWIWWVDSDAIFTDMVFEPPFESYKDVNLILWGAEDKVFKEKSWVGINAGDMIIRNCQWSLDLFDSIIPMGPLGDVRNEYGRMLTNFLSERGEMQADDQSAIVYMLNTQKEKYASKTFFENSFTMSGSWNYVTKEFEKMMEEQHPGLGDHRWPLITHFAGCQPCSTGDSGNFPYQECMDEMDRSLYFADNQVIHAYGLEHQNLGTWELQKLGTGAAGVQNTTTQTFQQKFH